MNSMLSVSKRYRAMKQVNQAAMTQTSCAEIFSDFCAVAGKVIKFDRAGLMMYEPERAVLRVAALCGSSPHSFFRLGAELNPEETPHGLALHEQQFVLRQDIRTEAEFEIEQVTLSEGLHSYCAVPLVVRGNSLGVVTMLTYRRSSYGEEHATFLQELSNQIALALASLLPSCTKHPGSKLRCPRCIASAGGLRTAARYKDQLSIWGRQGGRGNKRTSN
jgi:GAF domain-containing protein